MKHKSIILITLFALGISGCNMLFKVPVGGPELIPTKTFSIDEAAPKSVDVTDAEFIVAPSDASLTLAGGTTELVNGDIQYNVANWEPSLVIDGNLLLIEQTVPDNNIASTPKEAINEWNIILGQTMEYITISLTTGNYRLTFENSLPDGIAVNVHDGVGNLTLEFPSDVTASVEVQRGPANINTEGDWSTSGRTYTSGNKGPSWNVKVDIGVGNLNLVSR